MEHLAITAFWSWFRTQSDLLASREASNIVDVVSEALCAVDADITAEVFTSSRTIARAMTFTSHGNSDKFDLITSLVDASPDLDAWLFFALKPPRGFNFEVSGHEMLSISEWKFVPLRATSDFSEIAIRIEIPEIDRNSVDDLTVHQIVEEGVGEVLYSLCEDLFVSSNTTPNAEPIGILADTLHAWALTRGPNSMRKFLPDICY